MGIKDFSKTFSAVREVKTKDLAGKKLAIDAMTEIYRAALGAKSVNLLTDASGKPTLHISVILSNIIELQHQGIDQIWVFDYERDSSSNDFHNPAKLLELEKRRKRKDEAKKRLDEFGNDLDKVDVLFSDSDSENQDQDTKQDQDSDQDQDLKQEQKNKKNALEKQMFTATKEMINDIKLILNALNIKYITAPSGFEGEAIAAYLSATDKVDGVYSGDTDPIPFGAKILWRRNPRDKKIYEYTIDDILDQIKTKNAAYTNPNLDDVRKACIALGWDSNEKTKGIGAKTVLKKLDAIELSEAQQKVLEHFEQIPSNDSIIINNLDKKPFEDCQVKALLEWLTTEKSFTRSRILGWFNKVMDGIEEESGRVTAKPPAQQKTRAAKKTKIVVKKTTSPKPKPIRRLPKPKPVT